VLLRELLTPRRIRVPLQSTDKAGVLKELVGLVTDGRAGQGDDMLRAVEERESVLSTGIGHGVAIPHGKTSAVTGLLLAAGATPQPVPFEALDGEPVRLFFLVVGPEHAPGQHVKILGQISRLVRREQVREQLLAARDPEEFYRRLCEAESR